MENTDKHIAIIGAGPAGLTAAFLLQKAKYEVVLYEASNEVGGMARTIPLWGQLVDIGPHRFFSSLPQVNNFWLEMAGSEVVDIDRITRIYYKKKFFYYPLRPLNALLNLGLIKGILCLFSYVLTKFSQQDQSHFEGWVSSRFGKKLYEIFFKTYSEKLWGISCQELDSKFAVQRIKNFSLMEAIKSIFVRTNHKTLVDRFHYPMNGSGQVYNNILSSFKELGGNIKLKSRVSNISKDENFKVTTNVDTQEFDYIISTMPLTHLVHAIDSSSDEVRSAAKKLRFRQTRIAYLLIEGQVDFKDQWIYVHDDELLTGRVTNFSNWSKEIRRSSSDTILCLEYWTNEDDEIWNIEDNAFLEIAKREIVHTGLIGKNNILDSFSLKVPNCYPIYEKGHEIHLDTIRKYLSTIEKLYPIGRYGSFKYNNQDHSILMGIKLAEKIINKSDIDLWSINNDDEYQEASSFMSSQHQ